MQLIADLTMNIFFELERCRVNLVRMAILVAMHPLDTMHITESDQQKERNDSVKMSVR